MKVSVIGHSIVSPLGIGSKINFEKIKNGESAVQLNSNPSVSPEPTFLSRIDNDLFSIIQIKGYTRLESLMIRAIDNACTNLNIDINDEKTLVVLSTTKGNIDLLEGADYKGFNKKRSYLSELGAAVKKYFNLKDTPLIISNACISGGCAIEHGLDSILSKRHNNVVICGGDILSNFVISGFRSFHAMSDSRCAPYDKNRTGINLGEAAACIVLSNKKESDIQLIAGATSNDANHISGPSRTGEGLYLATQKALDQAGLKAKDIDYISAHGTATPFNDEMESIAFSRCGLSNIPLNSYKGYIGHTLGAAGVIESVISILCLKENVLIKSLGFEEHGVSEALNVITQTKSKEMKFVLKTGSGFGGGNNALIFGKTND